MTLRELTRPMHHACEQHPLGQRMVKGEISPQEWADWLMAFAVLHRRVDPALPIHMARTHLFTADFEWLRTQHDVTPREPRAAADWAGLLDSDTDKLGAAYVLHGAHRKGGPVLRKVLAPLGLPSAHTHYDRPADADRWVNETATQVDLVEAAQATFGALLRTMDEIAGAALFRAAAEA